MHSYRLLRGHQPIRSILDFILISVWSIHDLRLLPQGEPHPQMPRDAFSYYVLQQPI